MKPEKPFEIEKQSKKNMKKTILTFSIIAAEILLSSCGGNDTKESSSTNEPSSNEVTIGSQVWMTKNLDVSTFRNGDPIPEAKTEGEWKSYASAGEAAWCYYDNDPKNGEKYGKLYNWYAVTDSRGLAPKGYHVPSDEEWTKLTDFLGGVEKAGSKMKSKTGWKEDGNGTNSSGFSGLPGGLRASGGPFGAIGSYGNWWSSTEYDTYVACFRYLYFSNGIVPRYNVNKDFGFSVRCLRD